VSRRAQGIAEDAWRSAHPDQLVGWPIAKKIDMKVDATTPREST